MIMVLRVVLLSLYPSSCVTRKKTEKKNGRAKLWGKDQEEARF